MISLQENELRAILEDALIELTRGKGVSMVIQEALDEAISIGYIKTDDTKISRLLGCHICGSKLTEIRGRYPSEPRRRVCATCLQESFERIHEETSPDYGKAGQNKST